MMNSRKALSALLMGMALFGVSTEASAKWELASGAYWDSNEGGYQLTICDGLQCEETSPRRTKAKAIKAAEDQAQANNSGYYNNPDGADGPDDGEDGADDGGDDDDGGDVGGDDGN
jgi:hypothetical protein